MFLRIELSQMSSDDGNYSDDSFVCQAICY